MSSMSGSYFWLAHNSIHTMLHSNVNRTQKDTPHRTTQYIQLDQFFFDIKIKDNCLTRKKSNLIKDSYLLTMKNITQIILRFQNENIVFILDLIWIKNLTNHLWWFPKSTEKNSIFFSIFPYSHTLYKHFSYIFFRFDFFFSFSLLIILLIYNTRNCHA